MRIDAATFEPLIDRAGLSEREVQVFRLWCTGIDDNCELGRQLGVKPSTAAVLKHRARKKLRAAQQEYVRELQERIGRETEAEDAEDVATRAGLYRFLLQAMRRPVDSPSTPPVGLTWTECFAGVEIRMALDGAAHAGPIVTVSDLMRVLWGRPLGPNPYGRDTADQGPYEPLAVANRRAMM